MSASASASAADGSPARAAPARAAPLARGAPVVGVLVVGVPVLGVPGGGDLRAVGAGEPFEADPAAAGAATDRGSSAGGLPVGWFAPGRLPAGGGGGRWPGGVDGAGRVSPIRGLAAGAATPVRPAAVGEPLPGSVPLEAPFSVGAGPSAAPFVPAGPGVGRPFSDSDMREVPPRAAHDARPAACGAGAGSGRPAPSGSHRAPSRSIHWCVLRARASTRPAPSPSSNSPGRTPRGWVASSARRRHGPPSRPPSSGTSACSGTSDSVRTAGRRSSSTERPFRTRRTTTLGASSNCSTRVASSSAVKPNTSRSQVQDDTSCCREVPSSAMKAAAWTVIPSGSISDNRSVRSESPAGLPSRISPGAPEWGSPPRRRRGARRGTRRATRRRSAGPARS